MEQQTFPCHNCGQHNLIGQPFCGYCGQPFQYNCPTCGAPVNNTFAQCPQCNTPLYWPAQQAAAAPEPVQQPYQPDNYAAQYEANPQYYEEENESGVRSPRKFNLTSIVGLSILGVLIITAGILYATDNIPAFLSSSSEKETANENNASTTSSDTQSPDISSPTASSIQYNSATITWTTSELSTSLVEYGTSMSYGMKSQLDESYTTQHSITITGLDPDTKYYFRVLSVDEGGNKATSSNSNFNTQSSPDTVIPVISAISANVTATAATIHWTTDKLCTSQVDYGKTGSYGSSSALSQTLVKPHTVNLSGLSPDTTYHYRVRSKDSGGNEAVSSDMQFKTTTEDTLAPRLSGITYAITDNTTATWDVTVTWTTNEEASSEVEYGTATDDLDESSGEQDTTTRVLFHSVIIEDLDPEVQYYYRVISRDEAGNEKTSGVTQMGPLEDIP